MTLVRSIVSAPSWSARLPTQPGAAAAAVGTLPANCLAPLAEDGVGAEPAPDPSETPEPSGLWGLSLRMRQLGSIRRLAPMMGTIGSGRAAEVVVACDLSNNRVSVDDLGILLATLTRAPPPPPAPARARGVYIRIDHSGEQACLTLT